MSTDITDLAFNESETINVVTNGNVYTYVTSKFEFLPEGVMLEYTDVTLFRVFVPWHNIDRIFQNA